jgi:hypothetical protein
MTTCLSKTYEQVNIAIITLHPVVPSPYTLLSLLRPQASWFTCLELKDAFLLSLPGPG